jgi:hypothetical protein
MAETALVEPNITAGAELLRILDTTLEAIFAALWYRDPDAEDWRFVIGSDVVDREGPIAANRRLLEALRGYSWEAGISPLDVYVVGRRDPLVEALRSAPQVTGTIGPVHLSSALVGGRFIEDAYIYRNTWDGTASSVTRAASR